MQSIPVNFLDKVKFEINKRNHPQYFIQFWQWEGQLDSLRLQQALDKVYQQLPKLCHRLMDEEASYRYVPCQYDNTFVIRQARKSAIETLKAVLGAELDLIVGQSANAPVIMLKIDTPDGAGTLLCLLFNHVFCDGPSGYLIKELLVSNYNGMQSDLPSVIKSISDEEFIGQQINDRELFNKQLEDYQSQSRAYLSDANSVHLFYREGDSNTVNFDYFEIDTDHIVRTPGISLNSLVSTAIAKSILALKASTLKGSISVSVTANVRQEESKLLGNYVSAIPVKLDDSDMRLMSQAFQQQIDRVTMAPQRMLLSYANFARGFAQASPQQLMEGFRLISTKSNCYISNFGHYNRNDNEALTFSGTQLVKAGGFNFPLQGHYGLILTLVPYGDRVGLGIAASDLVLNANDLEQFKALVRQQLSSLQVAV